MDPSCTPAAPSSLPWPKSVPSFRRFLSVELPFTLTPVVSRTAPCSLAVEDKQDVEAFLPPPSVVEFGQPLVLRSANRPSNNPSSRENFLEDDKSRSGSSSNRGGSDGSSGSEDDDMNDATTDATANRVGTALKIGAQKPEVRLLTRHRRDYCTEPIFRGWRSTNWGAASDRSTCEKRNADDSMGKHSTDGLQDQKRRRLEVFSSMEPQLLLHGYYRNDLLVQVRRTRRIRRYRDPVTNAVLREDFMGNEAVEETGTKERPSSPPTTAVDNNSNTGNGAGSGEPTFATEVLGVVSREIQLARPADFTFSLFTPEQQRASPSLCGADFFPPAHYLSAKAPFEMQYEPGRYENISVTTESRSDLALGIGTPNAYWEDTFPGSVGHKAGVLPTISVNPEDTMVVPTRPPEHDEYLRSLPSSLDGSHDDDPPEVRMIVRLLAMRPVWIVQDLLDTMMQSGMCPRFYRNKQVTNCFTYTISAGPFNRLRIRFGYDPYANSSSAAYQRIPFTLNRRSDAGVRLRDLSRSPFIESVLRLLLERDQARRASNKGECGDERRWTLLKLQCHAIRGGRLDMPYQLFDVTDDPIMADILRNVAAVDAPMERSQRRERSGWLGEAAYTRAVTRFQESLVLLLEQEVEPLLRKFKGEAEATQTKKGDNNSIGVPTASPQTASLADEDEEDRENDDSDDASLSAMSSATAGDPSSDEEYD